jgi:hypothetical protein
VKQKPPKPVESVFQEGIEEIKQQYNKTKKVINPKLKEANIEPLEQQEMDLRHETWVGKFLFPYSLDTKKNKDGVLNSDKYRF